MAPQKCRSLAAGVQLKKTVTWRKSHWIYVAKKQAIVFIVQQDINQHKKKTLENIVYACAASEHAWWPAIFEAAYWLYDQILVKLGTFPKSSDRFGNFPKFQKNFTFFPRCGECAPPHWVLKPWIFSTSVTGRRPEKRCFLLYISEILNAELNKNFPHNVCNFIQHLCQNGLNSSWTQGDKATAWHRHANVQGPS